MDDIYRNYRAKQIKDHAGNHTWWVVADSAVSQELKIAKVPHWIKHPRAVALAISKALNETDSVALTDLI